MQPGALTQFFLSKSGLFASESNSVSDRVKKIHPVA